MIGERHAAVVGRPPRGGRGLKFDALVVVGLEIESPSSRRAWIEISCYLLRWLSAAVALLAEGVD